MHISGVDVLATFHATAANVRILRQRHPLTGRERTLSSKEVIVSKTDSRGVITYANDVFIRMSGFSGEELVGTSHSILRHPDMPGCVFRLLWQIISSGRECFAYVVNRARNGDHYWVLAHILPTFSSQGRIIGYRSSQHVPRPAAVESAATLYKFLREVESEASALEKGVTAGMAALRAFIREAGGSYEELIASL